MKKTLLLVGALFMSACMFSQENRVYFNDFEAGAEDATLTVVGSGEFVDVEDKGFGKVFKNVGGAMRSNYLLLPSDVLSHSTETKEMSISVWVNSAHAGVSADYAWSPLFMAYGAAPVDNTNTWPMLALQYRGLAQVNCAGWCDFTDAQNVTGFNTLYHNDLDWLADKKWHLYTVALTTTTAKVYFDGEIVNQWLVDGVTDNGQIISGLFSNGADLKYICLGGNQAWDWLDNDPGFMFDDMAIYNTALNQEEIKAIMAAKTGGTSMGAIETGANFQVVDGGIELTDNSQRTQVYAIDGRLIADTYASSISLTQGLYLVKVGDSEAKKVLIK